MLILEYAKENIKAQIQGLVERRIYRILTKVWSRRYIYIYIFLKSFFIGILCLNPSIKKNKNKN